TCGRLAIRAGALVRGGDYSIIGPYYERFFSGADGRVTGDNLVPLARQDSDVMQNLMAYKMAIEPVLTADINAQAQTGTVDLNRVRDDIEGSLGGLVQNVTFSSNGTLFLVIDRTTRATLE